MATDSVRGAQSIADELAGWIGKTESIDDEITLSSVRRMAAMLDLEPASFDRGSVIPPHWYSMFFTPNARRSAIGMDGHPMKGGFLPPVPLPRRMFVGRRVEFPGMLRVGDHAVKRSEIVSIQQKQGRSGTLVFVTVQHTILVDDRPAVVERQNIVYRDAAPAEADAGADTSVRADADWQATWDMDPVLVFRYSALTWNGHRIHYDADYAREEEGYPGCVMNGALTVHLVVEEALRRAQGTRLAALEARLVKPLFVGGTVVIAGQSLCNGTMQAWASDARGALAVICGLEFKGRS